MDLPYNRKIRKAYVDYPQSTYSRRTFDRRLSTISPGDIKNRITAMGKLFFICDKIVDDPSIYCFNRHTLILIKAKGSVWHKSSMTNGVVPRSAGIDTADARW